ncbi:MAG: hypothetical protein AB1390_07895 [Nitrospirota bacterium]
MASADCSFSAVGRPYFAATYSGDIFVIVGAGGIIYSPDGVNWTISSAYEGILRGITYGNGTFVTVGDSGAILTSPDGIEWTPRTLGISNPDNS